LSKGSGDTAKVVIIPIAIGKYISQLDPSESMFHVEHFERQSEVWLSFEWNESNTRRSRLRERLAVERIASEKHNARVKEIIALLPEQLGVEYNNHLAEMALRDLKGSRFDKVLQALQIAEKLHQYEEEDSNEMPKTTMPE
jgi:hypothetical protein